MRPGMISVGPVVGARCARDGGGPPSAGRAVARARSARGGERARLSARAALSRGRALRANYLRDPVVSQFVATPISTG